MSRGCFFLLNLWTVRPWFVLERLWLPPQRQRQLEEEEEDDDVDGPDSDPDLDPDPCCPATLPEM